MFKKHLESAVIRLYHTKFIRSIHNLIHLVHPLGCENLCLLVAHLAIEFNPALIELLNLEPNTKLRLLAVGNHINKSVGAINGLIHALNPFFRVDY